MTKQHNCDTAKCPYLGAVQHKQSKKYLCEFCWKKLRVMLSHKGLLEWRTI